MKHLKGSWAEDKAMDWTHLESKASRPGFVAGGTSARAHVAGERLAAAPEPHRALHICPWPRHAVEIGCRACRGGGTNCEVVGESGWLERGASNFLFYFFIL